MSSIKSFFQRRIVLRIGQLFSLLGIAVVFASCYAPAPAPEFRVDEMPYDTELVTEDGQVLTEMPEAITTKCEEEIK